MASLCRLAAFGQKTLFQNVAVVQEAAGVVFAAPEEVLMSEPLASPVTHGEQGALPASGGIVDRAVIQVMAHQRRVAQLLVLNMSDDSLRRVEVVPAFVHLPFWANDETVYFSE